MAGAGAGREVRLLERVWAVITGQEVELEEEKEGEEKGEGEEEMPAKRRQLEEEGMELLRSLVKKKKMEEESRKDAESGYPRGLSLYIGEQIAILP